MATDQNGYAVEIARLQERTDRNQSELDGVKTWVSDLGDDVKEVKTIQNQSLVVLQKMETTLGYMAEKLQLHDIHDEKIQGSIDHLQIAHTKVASKFKIVLSILAVIGTAIVGVAVKLLFFSPVLNG